MFELPETRQSLLLRLRQQSGDAWEDFLEIYENAIYQYCRRRGLQDADARDVTQDVLAAVDRKLAVWEHDPSKAPFRGWLFRVARNIAVDKYLEQSRRAVASGGSRVVQALAQVPEDREQESARFWYEYRRELMHRAAAQIKPDIKATSWHAFWKTAVEGQKPEAVAQQLGVSVGSVYAAKFRVVSRIRQIVSQWDDSDCIDESLIQDQREDSS